MWTKLKAAPWLSVVVYFGWSATCSAQNAGNAKTPFAPGSASEIPYLWIGSALGAFFLIVLVGILVKMKRRKNARPEQEISRPITETATSNGSGANGHTKPQPQPLRGNGFKSKAGTLRSFSTRNGGPKGSNGAKRAFDYNRYFTDLMASVYSQSYAVEPTPPPAEPLPAEAAKPTATPAPVNGHSHDRNGNGYLFEPAEMISTQKSLIEDQRRLIQEQTKVIEEKSRLIAEKNQLLKMQTELIEQKLL